MKTLILGIALFMTGVISFAVLCGATVATTYTNGSLYYGDIWRMFGITPIAIGFIALGVIGLIVAVIGLFIKK